MKINIESMKQKPQQSQEPRRIMLRPDNTMARMIDELKEYAGEKHTTRLIERLIWNAYYQNIEPRRK